LEANVNTVQFGVFLSPRRDRTTALLDQAQTAEHSGFHYVSIQDHPYVPDFLDPFAIIGVLAGRTENLRFMTNVANLPLRPPAMLAKTAASLDVLSGGRFELGLGGGRSWPQIVGMGGPHWRPGQVVRATDEAITMPLIVGMGGPPWQPGQVVRATDEAITILHALWQSEPATDVEGEIFQLTGVVPGPAPAHRVGIWLGIGGPRMLRLLGRRADGWIAPMGTPFETKPPAQHLIDTAARQVGRQPTDIRRVIQLVGTVTDRADTTERPRTGPGAQPIRTTPEVWARIIAEFITAERFDTVNFVPEHETAHQIEKFGTEVIPAALDLVHDRKQAVNSPV
jgi:alkanesulfonate monooxygenase SsuD/methylene tetrahydromethanopterin reductase-like flavin-dependent oxidoreductase (luciferase family)